MKRANDMESVDRWDRAFFEKRIHIIWRDEPVCKALISQFRFQSVIDIGCSIGEFVKWFLDHGYDAWGIEGTKNVIPHLLFPEERLIIRDIRKLKRRHGLKYDLAWCCMVVGRIPVEYWPTIAQNIDYLSNRVVTVVEDGVLWTSTMERVGYTENIEAANGLKQSLEPIKDKTAVRAIYNCVQVFEKGD